MRQVVTLDLVLLGRLRDFRHASIVRRDDPFEKALMIEASGAAAFAVAGAGAHDQRQVARSPGFDETLLERGVQTSGMQLWTKPVVATTSPSSMSAIASSAEMTLFVSIFRASPSGPLQPSPDPAATEFGRFLIL